MSRTKDVFQSIIAGLIIQASAIYAYNRIIDYRSCTKHALSTSPENYYNWKGVKVYYQKQGSGSPLILLHALHPAASAYEWSRVEQKLAEEHTVYTIDLPGCGRSGKPDAAFTNFYYVQFLKDFIKDQKIEKPVVAASNLTAGVAVMTAAYDESLLSRLVLINPSSLDEIAKQPTLFHRTAKSILELPLVGTFFFNMLARRDRIDDHFAERYFYNPFHDTDDLVDAYYESAHLGHGNGRFFTARLYGRMLYADIRPTLAKLQIPVKIIEGGDTQKSKEAVAAWTDILPSIETVYIKHTKQLPMLEEPELTAWEINSFI